MHLPPLLPSPQPPSLATKRTQREESVTFPLLRANGKGKGGGGGFILKVVGLQEERTNIFIPIMEFSSKVDMLASM